ncbi:MAG: carbohydrate-binding family 9-like protein, partial [Chitinophagaceae bacterium]
MPGIIQAQGGQLSTTNIDNLLQIPGYYTVLKTNERMVIDGKDNEKAWAKAPWTDWFTDIVSGEKSPFMGKTRCKMLWDDHYLYVYAQLQETDIRATFRIHDKPVFTDNSFEMYLNPDGSTHNYFEFQINAFGTTCDIFLPKPYRNGGLPLLSWDLKGLKKAVFIDGTLNNPADTDKYWSVELAIPFTSVVMGYKQFPKTGTIWRMNFSRVEWPVKIKHGHYVPRKKGEMDWSSGHYTVWSPQGLVDLHYPERWGYVMFSDKKDTTDFLSEKGEKIKLILWKYYYLQQIYKSQNGHYAISIDQLNAAFLQQAGISDSKLKMEATPHQFWMECYLPIVKE